MTDQYFKSAESQAAINQKVLGIIAIAKYSLMQQCNAMVTGMECTHKIDEQFLFERASADELVSSVVDHLYPN